MEDGLFIRTLYTGAEDFSQGGVNVTQGILKFLQGAICDSTLVAAFLPNIKVCPLSIPFVG